MEVDLLGSNTERGIGIVVQVGTETILHCCSTIVLVGSGYLAFNFFGDGSKGGIDYYRSINGVGDPFLHLVVGIGVIAECVGNNGSVDGGA